MTNMQLAGRLLSAPRRFFDELAESPRFALPMWVILLCTCGMVFWFYSAVDLQWLIDQQMANNPNTARMTDAQRATAARFMTRGVFTWGALLATFMVIFVFRLLEALYYRIAGRLTGHARSYRQWFAFAWWTATPGLIGVIPTFITLLFSTTSQIDPATLQPLSLNTLFFHLKPGDPGYQVMTNVSVLMVASLALTVFGVKVWSKRSWLYSVIFALLPAALMALLIAASMVRR